MGGSVRESQLSGLTRKVEVSDAACLLWVRHWRQLRLYRQLLNQSVLPSGILSGTLLGRQVVPLLL